MLEAVQSTLSRYMASTNLGMVVGRVRQRRYWTRLMMSANVGGRRGTVGHRTGMRRVVWSERVVVRKRASDPLSAFAAQWP